MSEHTLTVIGNPSLRVIGGATLQTLSRSQVPSLQGGMQGPPGVPGDGAPPVGTFAQMRALTGMVDGFTYHVTNYGSGGSDWHYVASLGDWLPKSLCQVFESQTEFTGVQQTAAQALQAIPVEAYLLLNKKWRLLFTPGKVGSANVMIPELHFGPTGTVADPKFPGSFGGISGAQISAGKDSWWWSSDANTLKRMGGQLDGSFNGVAFTLAAWQALTGVDLTVKNYITIGCTMNGTSDTPKNHYARLEILP